MRLRMTTNSPLSDDLNRGIYRRRVRYQMMASPGVLSGEVGAVVGPLHDPARWTRARSILRIGDNGRCLFGGGEEFLRNREGLQVRPTGKATTQGRGTLMRRPARSGQVIRIASLPPAAATHPANASCKSQSCSTTHAPRSGQGPRCRCRWPKGIDGRRCGGECAV